jgi:aminoglycoside phosphotransferase (APT) family kinase protein
MARKRSRPDVQRAAFFRDFGAAVGRLHAVNVGYFSGDLASSERETAWASVVDARLDRVMHDHRQTGLLPRPTLERAGEVVRSRARTVSPAVRPSLVHRDLYLPNTLVADGRFRCLLDFEHARSADALYDFPKLTMWVFEKFRGAAAAFHSGYGSNPLSTAEGRTRYQVTFGLELLSGMLYFKKTEQAEMLADYQQRVEPWLAAGA